MTGRYLKHDLKLGDGEMAAVIDLLGLLATSMPAASSWRRKSDAVLCSDHPRFIVWTMNCPIIAAMGIGTLRRQPNSVARSMSFRDSAMSKLAGAIGLPSKIVSEKVFAN